jgi:alkanesulfonate monooxygenase SsuD/methylene tetrahydromethanopterin reductase-like flavin-dependent oxidoreductase (luciferase family)
LRHKCDVLRAHCQAVGRDYDQIRKAYPLVVYLSEDRAAAQRWAGDAVDRQQIPAFAGDPAGLRERLQEIADVGFDVFLLSFAGFPELDDIRLFARKVLPAFS